MSVINHTDANAQQPAWPSANLLPQGVVPVHTAWRYKPGPGEVEVPGFLDTRWGGGWLCAVDAAEGFPSSPLGWPTGKSAHERSSQVSSEDCALDGTQTLGCMVMFAFLWSLFLGGRECLSAFHN